MKNKNKKNIIIFSGYYLPFLGGIERYTNMLSKHLIDEGYNVTIVCSNHDNLKDFEIIDKIKIFRLPIKNIFKSRYPIPDKNKKYQEIWKKICETKYDYVIANTRFQLTTLLGIKISNKQKIPMMILDHGSSHFTVNNIILDFFGRIYEHLLTSIIKKRVKYFYGVSKRCCEWLKHFKIKPSGVIYNSIDGSNYEIYKDKYFLESNDKIIITYAGRIIKEKGIENLCEVYNKISDDYKNIELYVAGDGPILNELKNKYKKINFLGKLDFDSVMKLYNSTDIFVYPSMFPEGLPTSILEAGLMKSAIIATDRGGTLEVICDEEYGLIMEENKESLEEKLRIYLNNPEKINELKKNIHNRVIENFTWKTTTKKLIKELNKLNEE